MKEKSAADINMATTYGKFTAIADSRRILLEGSGKNSTRWSFENVLTSK
jgi:hypothetical protein